jgi:O-antigen/teichoic acid export membrane protein
MLRAGASHQVKQIGCHAMRAVAWLLPSPGMSAEAAPEIVSLFFGPAFSPTAPLLAVLVFGALALVMISVATAILTTAGKSGLTFTLTGPLVPLGLAGHLLQIPRLGALGASLVTTLFASLGAPAAVLAVYRLW